MSAPADAPAAADAPSADAPWHLAIRHYSGTGPPEEIGRRVREGLLPVLRQEPGFRAYFAARLDGGGGVFSVTIFDDRAALAAASERVFVWAGEHLRDLLTSPPDVTFADVKLHRAAPGPGTDGYVSVRVTDGLGPPEEVLPAVQQVLVPLVTSQPGFRHYYAGRDEKRAERSVAVLVFNNRETATAANEQAAAAMARHRAVWPTETRVIMAGEAMIAVVAGK
jgi:hypothetical protein